MRRRLPAGLAVLSAGLLACADQPTAVSTADTAEAPAMSKGAVHNLPDPFCAVVDGVGEFVIVDCKQAIATYSTNGNAVIKVQASGVYNPTGTHVTWDAWNPGPAFIAAYEGVLDPPLPCVLADVNGDLTLWTLNWRATVTPSGEAKLQCWYSAQSAFEWP